MNPTYSTTAQDTTDYLRVPFGLKDGRMWTATQVPPGLECGCVCLVCKAPLIATTPDSANRRPHFAHYRETDCRGDLESALYRMATQLIEDRLRIQLPCWDGAMDMPNPERKHDDRGTLVIGRRVEFPAHVVQLQSAVQGQSRGDYVPDVTATDEHGELLIQIRVRHDGNGVNWRKVQSDGVRLFEIDLTRVTLDQALDETEFERLVLDEPRNRQWISHPAAAAAWRVAADEFKQAFRERNQQIKVEAKGVEAKQALQTSKQHAKEANKVLRRELIRHDLRWSYESMLASLHDRTRPEFVENLLRERWLRDRHPFEELVRQLDSPAVGKALQQWHKDAWVYNAHPVYWQARVYRKFIQDEPPGAYISQVDAARWARTEIGVEFVLGELFLAQYAAMMNARSAGYFKETVSAWYFTPEENLLIPNLYDPFDDLFSRLVDAGAICRVKDGPHRYMRAPVQ